MIGGGVESDVKKTVQKIKDKFDHEHLLRELFDHPSELKSVLSDLLELVRYEN